MDADTIKCTQCSKSFLKKAKLTAHMKTVHSGIKYDCDFCEKQYGSKQGLTTHRKTIHKEELQNTVDIPTSNNPHSSLSPNHDAATALLRAKSSSTKKDDQVNNAKKSNDAKKVPVQKSSSKLAEKDLEKETVSPVSNFKNKNEFYFKDKQEKGMEKESLNKVNPKKGQNLNPNIKFDFTPFESQKIIEIKAEGNVSKESVTHSLQDQPNHVKSTSFASDCQINHEECPDKHFDKPDEMVQTEVEDDDKESCLWAHCDNQFSDEELEFPGASANDHSEEKVLELQVSKGNNLKNSEVGFNPSTDKPTHSTEPQNVTQNSGISLESFVLLKKEKNTDISQETTPEVVEEFVCGTIGCKKKFTAKEDLDEHMKTADGENRKCPLCLKDFFNEECRKYHKDQNCGNDTESDEDDEDYEDDDEDECDEDDILDGPEKEIEGLKKDNEKVKVMGREHNKLDVYDNLKETDDDKQIVSEPLDFDKDKIYQERNDTLDKVEANSKLLVDDDVQYSAKNAIPTAVKDAQHPTIDGIQMPTKDVYQPTNAFIQSSPSYVQPKSDSQAPTQYAQHLTKEGIQPLTNYAQFPSKDAIEIHQNNVQYPTENATQTPTNDVQRYIVNATQPPTNDAQNFTEDTNKISGNQLQTLTNNFEHSSQGTIPITANNVQHSARSVNQKPAKDIKPHTQNGNQGPVNDVKHPIESGNQVQVNDVKHPTKNDSEDSSSDILHPSGTNNELQNTDSTIEQSQNIRPGIEVEDTNMGHKNKAPKEKTLSLKEKQLLYRYEQQWKQFPSYSKPMPYSPEQIIQMSLENFEKISASLNPFQFQFCQMIREKFLKWPSKPAPSNIMEEKLPTDNSMRNLTIPKQMLKRKVDLVNNEQMSKKIHLDSKAVKEEDEDTSFNKIRQSVLKGLNLGKNHENYEVIIEDGTVKLRIIGKHDNSSRSLDEDNYKASGQDNPKWKTYSDCNGGPTIPEGWKMCFEEQTMEGRKVMVAKYMNPEGKFYNRGPNGYDEIPNFQK